MWGLFKNHYQINNLDYKRKCTMTDIYKKKGLKVNLAFFALILSSFIFLNLIFIKNISRFENGDESLILVLLNIIFLMIVVYTIGNFTFSVNSLKDIEDKFIDQLEKNIELKTQFNEKSRYIRKKFKKKLLDFKSKKKLFFGSFKGFLAEQINNSSQSLYRDSYRNLRTTFEAVQVGLWSWDIKKDLLSIDNICCEHLALPKDGFVGGYGLFINLFTKESKRSLKKDVAYCFKFKTPFETYCKVKANPSRIVLLKGSLVYDEDGEPMKLTGMLMLKDSPKEIRASRSKFFKQSLAMFAILDKDFRFEFLNPVWVGVTGYSLHELKKYPMFNFIHQRERRMFLNNFHVAKEDNDARPVVVRNRFRVSDGSFIDLNFTITYENYRYYVLADPVKTLESKGKKEDEFSFEFKETLGMKHLRPL